MIRLHCALPEDTTALGRALGRVARPGTVVALLGDLGAGKTCLSQGVGEGLEVPTLVQSPTFIIIQEHPDGRLPLLHCDLYRVEDPAELEHLGLEELLEGDGVALVEWADRQPDVLPVDHLQVQILHAATGRDVIVHATGPRHAYLEEVLGG